ncbi:unnamed protein product, partial [Phaeothamnion confervicola]
SAPAAGAAPSAAAAPSSGFAAAAGGGKLPRWQSLMFCTQDMYVLLRLHHVLVERLAAATRLCAAAADTSQPTAASEAFTMNGVSASSANTKRAGAAAAATAGAATTGEEGTAAARMEALLALTYAWAEGGLSPDRFDEGCRQLVGSGGYILSTLDKILKHFLKYASRVGGDGVAQKLQRLFLHEAALAALSGGGFDVAGYRDRVRWMMRRRRRDELVRVQYCANGSGAVEAADGLTEAAADGDGPAASAAAAADGVSAMDMDGVSAMGVTEDGGGKEAVAPVLLYEWVGDVGAAIGDDDDETNRRIEAVTIEQMASVLGIVAEATAEDGGAAVAAAGSAAGDESGGGDADGGGGLAVDGGEKGGASGDAVDDMVADPEDETESGGGSGGNGVGGRGGGKGRHSKRGGRGRGASGRASPGAASIDAGGSDGEGMADAQPQAAAAAAGDGKKGGGDSAPGEYGGEQDG